MSAQESILSFRYRYFIAISIIIALLITSQVLIQLTLQHEVERRAEASVIGRQRTKDLLLSSYSKDVALGYQLSPTEKKDMIQTYSDWQKVEAALEGPGSVQLGIPATFTPDIEAQIKLLHQDYAPLQKSFGFIVWNETAAHPIDITKAIKASSKQVAVMLAHDVRYQATILAIFTLLSNQANDNVTNVQIIEFVVFLATLTVIGYEILVAFLPAYKDLQKALETQEARTKRDEASATSNA